MFHRRPAALDQLTLKTSVSIARLVAFEGFSRAILVGVIPLVVLESLGSKEAVSRLYLVSALLTMLVTLNLGTLERLFHRRWVVTLGGGFLLSAAGLLYLQNDYFLLLGIGMRSAAASIFSVCMSLYIMDYIGKRDLTRSESRRMQHAGAAWLIGPFLGTWLVAHDLSWVAFALAATSSLVMLAYFWTLRLGDNQVVKKATSTAKNPIAAIRSFTSQKYMRIAYGITLSRSCFWVAMFVYGPIYIIEAGLPTWVAGVMLSGISGMLFLSPLVRMASEKIGTRKLIVAALILTGLSTLALGLLGKAQPIGIVFWVTGGMGGFILDVLGNIPFMRMVKAHQRTSMTSVFSTWREASEVVTPTIVSLVLLWYDFRLFFVVLSLMHFSSAYSASKLPRRL